MSNEISMPTDIVAFAEELIRGESRAWEFKKIYEFEDDEQAHDDTF